MSATQLPGDIRSRLDAVIHGETSLRIPELVKAVLIDSMQCGALDVPAPLKTPLPDTYARRLLHRDPSGQYTMVVMTWGVGQKTSLHDHAGIWCVECVYKGQIQVTSFSCRGGDPERDLVKFEKETVIHAGVGQAGALIPPFEYHVLENADTQPTITLHVYGGELDHCHIFEPVGDAWVRRYRELTYTA